MAQYATLKAAIDAVIKANGQKEITGTVLNEVLTSMVNSLGANYQFAGVATPSTNPGTPDQNVFYLAFEAGTYTNFNATVLSAGISILKWNGSWSSQTFYTIDATPTASSSNLISSGAVFDAIKTDGSAYDVSAHFPTGGPNSDGKFTLEYILSNANTFIPAAWRKGGMSIRFVSSSDNNYMQFRCIADEFTTDTTQWAIADEGVYVENPEFVYVKTDNEGKILWAIKTDGSIYYGAGVPQQVIDYINERIAEFSPDEYEDIVAFLNGLEEGDKTLQTLLNEKVDKEEGKSLIDSVFAANQSVIENPKFMQVEIDNDGRILSGRKNDGTKFENCPYEFQSIRIGGATTEMFKDREGRIVIIADKDGKLIAYRSKDGVLHECTGISVNSINGLSFDYILYYGKKEISERFVPDVYADELKNKCDAILDASFEDSNSDTFVFYTDRHSLPEYEDNLPSLLRYIVGNTFVSKVVFGGDAVRTGNETRTGKSMQESLLQLNKDINATRDYADYFFIRGNHEITGGDISVTPNVGYTYSQKTVNSIVRNLNHSAINYEDNSLRNDYYFDNVGTKIRYIVVDMWKAPDNSSPTAYSNTENISPSQLQWIYDILMDLDNGWNVVFLQHAWSIINYGTAFDYYLAFINAAQDHSSLDGYDFSNFKGNILAVISGHAHRDCQTIYKGILHCVTTIVNKTSGTLIPMIGTDTRRTYGEVSEYAIDTFVLMPDKNIIKTIRTGYGYSRWFNLNKVQIAVNETYNLTSTLDNVTNWGCYDSIGHQYDTPIGNPIIISNTVLSIQNGVVEGVSSGEGVAYAIDETKKIIEFFYIVVI